MKHIIPLVRDIEFNNHIASIESISLEDNFKIENNEVVGEFIVFGDYKIHSDTTEKELFKEKIPFNVLIPDNMSCDTVKFDIDDFTYEINDNVLKVCIDVSLVGEEIEIPVRDKDDARDVEDIWGLNNEINNNYLEEDILNDIDNNVNVINNINVDNSVNNTSIVNNEVYNETNEVNDVGEYIIYHIHIINEGDNIDNIISKYNTNIDILKEYNDISKLNIGDKLVIPDIYYGTN